MKLLECKFFLRNGMTIEVKCETLKVKKNYGGEFVGYSMKGIHGAVPQHIDIREIVAITSERKAYEDEEEDERR